VKITTAKRQPIAALTIGVALLSALSSVSRASQGKVVTIFGGTDLTDWKVEGADVDVDSSVLRVRQGPGWVRTEKPHGDFVLRAEVRLTGQNAEAGIFVRAYPALSQGQSPPSVGYEIALRDTPSTGEIMRHSLGGRAVRIDRGSVRPAFEEGGWHRYEIECAGTTLKVTVDGAQIAAMGDLGNPSGYLAFRTQTGIAEFRNVQLATMSIPGVGPGVEIIEIADQIRPGSGVGFARSRSPEPVPRYTNDARQLANERLEGGLVNVLSFVDVDRAACVSVETRVEEREFQRCKQPSLPDPSPLFT
jgi:Domain of Unknown Function (DUF1080)